MKYIKIKVKYVLLAALIFAVIYSAIPAVYAKIAQNYHRKGKNEYAAAYYEKSFGMTPDTLKGGEDIYDYANILSGYIGERDLYMIFSFGRGGMGSSIIPTEEALEKSIGLYKSLLDNHEFDPWSKWANVRLAEIYLYKGDYDKAEKYLYEARNNVEARLVYDIYKSKGEYEEGIDFINKYLLNNKKFFDIGTYNTLAMLHMDMNKYDEAISVYDGAISDINERIKAEKPDDNYYNEKIVEFKKRIKRIEELKTKSHELGEASGKVTMDGKGVEGVRVYIRDKIFYEEDYFGGSSEDPYTTTDKEGYYSFKNILPGRYDIGIGIGISTVLDKAYLERQEYQKDLISNGTLENNFEFTTPIKILGPEDGIKIGDENVEITWETVDNAEYYSLHAGIIYDGSYGYSKLIDNIKGNKAIINIEKIIPISLGFASFSDENKPTPGTLLGIYGGGKAIYGIEVYDKNHRLINSSMPVLKSTKSPRHFIIDRQELEGDRLIKEGDYEKARDWFIDYLSKNTEDEHSLYVLGRYYEYCEKNYDKASEYFMKLYEITGREEYKVHEENMKKHH